MQSSYPLNSIHKNLMECVCVCVCAVHYDLLEILSILCTHIHQIISIHYDDILRLGSFVCVCVYSVRLCAR